MTLDDYFPTDTAPALVTEPKRCRRHDWTGYNPFVDQPRWTCSRCGKPKDEARSRRGKTSRNRGNGFEREVAAKLGGRRVGMYGDKVDVDVPGYMRAQCKNGASYPERIDGWLRAIPVEAGILRAVVLGDAPGPGRRRRSLIVFDLDEFSAWHGASDAA